MPKPSEILYWLSLWSRGLGLKSLPGQKFGLFPTDQHGPHIVDGKFEKQERLKNEVAWMRLRLDHTGLQINSTDASALQWYLIRL